MCVERLDGTESRIAYLGRIAYLSVCGVITGAANGQRPRYETVTYLSDLMHLGKRAVPDLLSRNSL